jgi:hypothetical protein
VYRNVFGGKMKIEKEERTKEKVEYTFPCGENDLAPSVVVSGGGCQDVWRIL